MSYNDDTFDSQSADAQRDLNISRLFTKIDNIRETVNSTRNEVSIIGTKVDDFSSRLRRLEEREEKHVEKEEQFQKGSKEVHLW